MKTGAALLGVNRTSIYYKGSPILQEELDCKAIIDRLHTDHPTWGARQMSSQPVLADKGMISALGLLCRMPSLTVDFIPGHSF